MEVRENHFFVVFNFGLGGFVCLGFFCLFVCLFFETVCVTTNSEVWKKSLLGLAMHMDVHLRFTGFSKPYWIQFVN